MRRPGRQLNSLPPCGLRDAHLSEAHIGPSFSSACGAASLRFAPSGDNAGPMWPLAIVVFADQSRLVSRLCAAKTTESQKPGPRGAVKAREAPAKRLGLDGEHGSGTPSCAHAVDKGGASPNVPSILPTQTNKVTPRNIVWHNKRSRTLYRTLWPAAKDFFALSTISWLRGHADAMITLAA